MHVINGIPTDEPHVDVVVAGVHTLVALSEVEGFLRRHLDCLEDVSVNDVIYGGARLTPRVEFDAFENSDGTTKHVWVDANVHHVGSLGLNDEQWKKYLEWEAEEGKGDVRDYDWEKIMGPDPEDEHVRHVWNCLRSVV